MTRSILVVRGSTYDVEADDEPRKRFSAEMRHGKNVKRIADDNSPRLVRAAAHCRPSRHRSGPGHLAL